MVRVVPIALAVVPKPRLIPMKAGDVFRGLLLLICCIGVFPNLGCVRPKSLDSNQQLSFTYPMWFWQPPVTLDFPVSVGYAPIYYRESSSLESATKNAVEQLGRQMHVRISGERIIINRVQAENFEESIPEAVVEMLSDKNQVLATHKSSEHYLALVGANGADVGVEEQLVSADSRTKPDWMIELPKSHGYLYGMGHHSRSTFRQLNGWLTAERNARIDLALTLKSYVRNLTKQHDFQFGQVFSTQTDVVLQRIEVVERWYDVANSSYHVLIRMPLQANRNSVITQLQQLVKQAKITDQPDQLSVQKIIDQTFHELDQVND